MSLKDQLAAFRPDQNRDTQPGRGPRRLTTIRLFDRDLWLVKRAAAGCQMTLQAFLVKVINEGLQARGLEQIEDPGCGRAADG